MCPICTEFYFSGPADRDANSLPIFIPWVFVSLQGPGFESLVETKNPSVFNCVTRDWLLAEPPRKRRQIHSLDFQGLKNSRGPQGTGSRILRGIPTCRGSMPILQFTLEMIVTLWET